MRHHPLLVLALLAAPCAAQTDLYRQTDFPAEEFQARWTKIFDKIGPSAVAIVQGFPKVSGFIFPRQTNEFYYLCGIETPQSYLVLDGKTRRATLFLPPRDERLERSEGRVLSASDSALARQITAAAEVLPTTALTVDWLQNLTRDTGRTIYTLLSPAEGYAQSRFEIIAANAAIAADYWDGRIPRESNFAELLRTRLPRSEIRDLTPILDELRSVKSPREIALIRRASQIAGLGILEAMRSTKAGLSEYHLDAAARYVFLINGARLDGYRSITASGTPNIANGHYYRNNSVLKDGDLVLMDYAPDYRYYVSDIGRMWPVNGKFSPWQRELLQFILEWRNAVIARIRPGVTTAQILSEARTTIEPVLQRTRFSKPIYEQAARRMITTSGGIFSHPVGMAVHDDGDYTRVPLQPGHVFSIDPQMWVPEENLYLRYEDVVAVTATGFENFTTFLPVELNDIEKTVRAGGVLQKRRPNRPGLPIVHNVSMSGRLSNKVAVITGAGGAIGQSMASLFAAEGAAVVIAEINPSTGQAAAQQISSAGGRAVFFQLDISHASQVADLFHFTRETCGGLDILVNNAISLTGDTTIADLEESAFDHTINVCLKGPFLCTRAAIPLLIERGGGSIVTISSVNALFGFGHTAYTAAKGGLISMMRLVAAEYGDRNIRSNVICPGTIATETSLTTWRAKPDSFRRVLDMYPLGRIGTPDEVARYALFLASDESSFVTGAVQVIDGGILAGRKFDF